MIDVYGIYGYEITQTIECPGFTIEPRTDNSMTSSGWAKDKHSYHLTAVIYGDSVDRELIFKLRAILSFIEQREILISGPHASNINDKYNNIAEKISIPRTGTRGNHVILQDEFSNNGRSTFILNSLSLLSDKEHCKNTKYDSLFFRNVETLSLHGIIVELFYFLHYSGLEAHARAVQNYSGNSAPSVITKQLLAYGLDVYENNINDDYKSIATYGHIRNSIFHNGELNPTVKVNQSTKKFQATVFLPFLIRLSNLTILKASNFDDGHINWNGWLDRQPFI